MRKRYLLAFTLAAGALIISAQSRSLFAASSPAVGLSVTANVAAKCIVSATSAVAFGTYDPVETHASTGVDLDGTGQVTIRCTPGNGIDIELDLGANASGSQRRMIGPSSATLDYELYQDTPGGTVWGTGGSALAIGAAVSTAPQNFTVHGRVPKGQDPAATGAFSDTVQATVNF